MRANIRFCILSVSAAVLSVLSTAIMASNKPTQQLAYATQNCDTPTTPFCDALMPPVLGWTGNVFHLSQSYPSAIPQDAQPWAQYDPKTQPAQYIQALLDYFYEGNIKGDYESSFNPATNTARKWYNAPWQDAQANGREFVHGLTRERVSKPGELAVEQTQNWNNYAVGFYNAPGGYTIGEIWANRGNPNLTLANMPEGTVAAKLLFTTAPISQVPYLQGAPAWQAYVYQDLNGTTFTLKSPRAITTLHLLQIDVAVKDSAHSPKTGWVFGTFVYGGGPNGPVGSGWNHVYPVGLMWGNGIAGTPGSESESWINESVHMRHLGYQGRLNGPVDNHISSCMSCHSTAEYKQVRGMTPSSKDDPTPWFRDIPSGTPFDSGQQALDYSLQVYVGLSNYFDAQGAANAKTPAERQRLLELLWKKNEVSPRDGGGGRVP